jgi:hypothetical protein
MNKKIRSNLGSHSPLKLLFYCSMNSDNFRLDVILLAAIWDGAFRSWITSLRDWRQITFRFTKRNENISFSNFSIQRIGKVSKRPV